VRQIIELVKKPEWWFSAVFIAIVASLIAAFAKDWISRGLSVFSQLYRTRRLLREAKLDEEAAILAAHSDLLIIEFIRAVGQEIAILGLIGLLLSAPFLIKAAGLGDKTTDSFALASIVIVAALLLVVVFYGIYRNTRHLNLCLRARKKLHEKLTKT
jgi:hypothetical protein